MQRGTDYPDTEAGRRLLEMPLHTAGIRGDYDDLGLHAAILAIEAEAAQGAAPRDWRAEVQHAFDAINAALDKDSYGDHVQGDLLEAHATLDTLLSEGAAPRAIGAEYIRLASLRSPESDEAR